MIRLNCELKYYNFNFSSAADLFSHPSLSGALSGPAEISVLLTAAFLSLKKERREFKLSGVTTDNKHLNDIVEVSTRESSRKVPM
jgi:hypothetical protein